LIKYHVTAGYMIQKEEEGKPLLKGSDGPPPAPAAEKDDADKPKDA